MKYTIFTRGELGYNPKYTKPLESEEVVVSPIRDSDKEEDINIVMGYTPIYRPIVENIMDFNLPKVEKSKKEKDFTDNYIKAFGSKDNMYTFFSRLAKNESGYNSTIRNRAGAPAWGYFQFMEDGKKWNNITRYAGVSKEEFLRNPVLQIRAAKRLATSFMSQLTPEDRAKAREKGITDSGLLGGMWLGGYGGLKRYLYHNENISDKHWSKTGAGIDMKNQIARYNGLFKKGGKILKGNTGMVFVNDPGDNRGFVRNDETLQFIRNTNGAIRYEKKRGKPTPEFWDRLRDTMPKSLVGPDGEPMNVLMSYGEDDGKYIVYPEIQEINGELTHLEGFDAMDMAYKTGNYIIAPSERIAKDFTENYKAYTEYFPAFKDVEKRFTPWRRFTNPLLKYQTRPNVSVPYTNNENDNKKVYTPTMNDLLKFTKAFEDFIPTPTRILKQSALRKSKSELTDDDYQTLVGYGFSDKKLIDKYKDGITREQAEVELLNIMNSLDKAFYKEKGYGALPIEAKLAILDAAYNTYGLNFFAKSPKLRNLIAAGSSIQDLARELNHSKSAGSWLGVRSASRRAMMLGDYNWHPEKVDKYGRPILGVYKGPDDHKDSPYYEYDYTDEDD